MTENSGTKQFAITVAAGLVVYAIWDAWLKKYVFDFLDDGLFNRSADGTGGSGDSWGTGGAGSGGSGGTGSGSGSGGSGGAGGAGTSVVTDYTALAAAINALAAGVQLPNLQSAVVAVSAGTTQLIPSEGGKRICVFCYAVSGSGTITAKWRGGSSPNDLWRIDLSAPAGNSGATQATAWPGYIFATGSGEALNFVSDGAAAVSVSYWREDA